MMRDNSPFAPPRILPPPTEMAGERDLLGLTATVPCEVPLAAGCRPVDLNNLFIGSPSPEDLIKKAERAGFPRTCCSWTKGIYGAVRHYGLQRIVVLVQGDCTNTHALAEMLEYEGVECIPFSYPYRPDAIEMAEELGRFARRFAVGVPEAEAWLQRLGTARQLAREIDRLSWQERKVHGLENHLWLVSTSDFCGNPSLYERGAKRFLRQARTRKPVESRVRIGLAGVPPIVPDIYDFLEELGAHVVYNETQRQFSMPGAARSLQQVYSNYTYPYGIQHRLKDIRREIRRRNLDGMIHYVQSFCYRRIEDRILKDSVPVPVITLEQDRPGPPPGQLRTRLEAFVELLRAGKSGFKIF